MRPKKIQSISSVNVVDLGIEGAVRKFQVDLSTSANALGLADFLAESGAYHMFTDYLEKRIREALQDYIGGAEEPLAAARERFKGKAPLSLVAVRE